MPIQCYDILFSVMTAGFNSTEQKNLTVQKDKHTIDKKRLEVKNLINY